MKVRFNREISATLMVANLISTVLVVSIHYSNRPLREVGVDLDLNFYFQEFMTNGVARVAVPFFALLAGFFLANGLKSGGYVEVLRSRFRSLIVPYLIAAALISILISFLKILLGHNVEFSAQGVLDVFITPPSGQFWFLRDLIVLTFISPVVLGPRAPLRVVVVSFFAVMWVLEVQPFPMLGKWYLLNIETVFFFALGGLLFLYSHWLAVFAFAPIVVRRWVFVCWVFILFFRVWVDPDLDVWYVSNYSFISLLIYKLAILVGLAVLLQVSYSLREKVSLIFLSGFTFFVFLFHLVPVSYFTRATAKVVSPEFGFYVNFPLALIFVFLLAFLLERCCPRAYLLVAGGRGSSKAIERLKGEQVWGRKAAQR